MKTEIFNKVFEATESIHKLEQVEEKLKKANERLKAEVDIYNKLGNELNSTAEVIVPLIKDYLNQIIDVRMAFGREVIHIIESARQLKEITKATPEINVAVDLLTKLNAALDPNLISKIKNTFNISGKS